MIRELDPGQYGGETLCPCCGVGFDTGNYYKICTDPSVTHQDSCERYNYSADSLCDICEEVTDGSTDNQ